MGRRISMVGRLKRYAVLLICISMAGWAILFHCQAPEESIATSCGVSLSEEQEVHSDAESSFPQATPGSPPTSDRSSLHLANAREIRSTREPRLRGEALAPEESRIDIVPEDAPVVQVRTSKRPPIGWPVVAQLAEVDFSPANSPIVLPLPILPDPALPMLDKVAGLQSAEDQKQIPLDRPLESSPPPSPEVRPVT